MMKEDSRRFDLEDRLVEFATLIIRIVESLPNTRTGNHLGNQLVRSGTSSALNYGEAQSAESRIDFIQQDQDCTEGTARDACLPENHQSNNSQLFVPEHRAGKERM